MNADDTAYIGASGTVIGHNLFAYCENNPVNRVDDQGYSSSNTNRSETHAVLANIYYNNKKAEHADICIDGWVYSYGNYKSERRPATISGTNKLQGRFLVAKWATWKNFSVGSYTNIKSYYISINQNEYNNINKFIFNMYSSVEYETKDANVMFYKVKKGNYIEYKRYSSNCAIFARDLLYYGLGKRFDRASWLPIKAVISPGLLERVVKRLSVFCSDIIVPKTVEVY